MSEPITKTVPLVQGTTEPVSPELSRPEIVSGSDNLTLYEQKEFGTLTCQIFQNDKNELFMTREQVGVALEYKNPQKAIGQIHDRSSDRLDSLSTFFVLRNVEGKRIVEREIICYTLRGVMEICRLSRQPKADAFMDFCWDVMESLYKGETVLATKDQQAALAPEAIRAMIDSSIKPSTDAITKLCAEQKRQNDVLVKIGMDLKRLTSSLPVSAQGTIFQPLIQPKTVEHSVSNWQKIVMSYVAKIAKARGIETKQELVELYSVLTKNYSFVTDQERREFYRRNPNYGKVTVIKLIESNPTYKSIFESIVRDEYKKWYEPAPDAKPVIVEAVSTPVPEYDAEHSGPEQAVSPAESVPFPAKARKIGTKPEDVSHRDRVSAIVFPIAQQANDTSAHYNLTYKRIYSRMNISWPRYETIYKRRHNTKRNPTHVAILIENDKAFAKFKLAAASYKEELSNETA